MILQRKERGFVLLIALGVLAVLGILIFGASTTTQAGWAFTEMHMTDVRMGNALDHIAVRLSRGDPLSGSVVLQDGDVTATATIGIASDASQVAAVIEPREGDQFVKIFARNQNGWTVDSLYLINFKAMRKSPILVSEINK